MFKTFLKDKQTEYNQVGRLSYASFFYKYLSLDSALLCIKNSNIRFVEPSRWQDKYERRFYQADYSSQNVDIQKECPLLFATCLTTTRYDEAAWVLYTYNKTGLGATCVEFQINKHKFRLQLAKALETGDRIYEGVVMYCSPTMIDNIHKKKVLEKGVLVDNKYYQKYVARKENLDYLNNYLNLLLMKRDVFKHENETRFFIAKQSKLSSPKIRQNIEGEKVYYGDAITLNIDWLEIIDKVYINAKEDSYEYRLLEDALRANMEAKYKEKTDKERNDIWDKRLKPIPYFVYGEALSTPLIIE